MHAGGIEIGAHSMTHPNLTRVDSLQVDVEAAGSRAVIEEQIGARVVSFAYPYGFHNSEVRRRIANHFECACGVDLGMATGTSDLFALERIEMDYLRSSRTFSLLINGGLAPYLTLRRFHRQIRHYIRRWTTR
jgi:peptidoglycan/xylan/chitin deacetylase (PgdA/CDA1 family)